MYVFLRGCVKLQHMLYTSTRNQNVFFSLPHLILSHLIPSRRNPALSPARSFVRSYIHTYVCTHALLSSTFVSVSVSVHASSCLVSSHPSEPGASSFTCLLDPSSTWSVVCLPDPSFACFLVRFLVCLLASPSAWSLVYLLASSSACLIPCFLACFLVRSLTRLLPSILGAYMEPTTA